MITLSAIYVALSEAHDITLKLLFRNLQFFFLHHRDLKPSNVLLDGNGRVKLSYSGVWEEVDNSVDPEAVEQLYCAPGMIQY